MSSIPDLVDMSLEEWDWLNSHKPSNYCTVQYCFTKIKGKGLCPVHYQRNRKHGSPLFSFGRDIPNPPPHFKTCTDCHSIVHESACMVRQSRCKECHNANGRRWKKENPDKVKDGWARYKLSNPDQHRKWSQENPDKIKRYRAKRKAQIRGSTNSELLSLLDIIKIFGLNCYLCGIETHTYKRDGFDKYDPEQSNLEHMTPLSRGGTHTLDNLRVSCAQCNFRKGPMTLNEYLSR